MSPEEVAKLPGQVQQQVVTIKNMIQAQLVFFLRVFDLGFSFSFPDSFVSYLPPIVAKHGVPLKSTFLSLVVELTKKFSKN
jgi:hypothetical protein